MQPNPYSSPINGEPPQRVSRRFSGLMVLSGVIGCYGVGFGVFLIFVGMYLGQHVLVAAVAHILFGLAFLASAVGINANKTGAYWAIIALSLILVIVSVLAIFESIADQDHASSVFWGCVFAFFLAIAACAFRLTRSLDGESNPAQFRGAIAEQNAQPEMTGTSTDGGQGIRPGQNDVKE